MLTQTVQWTELAREIGPGFAERAADHDENDAFVADNYVVLKENKVFSALVPVEFGEVAPATGRLRTTARTRALLPVHRPRAFDAPAPRGGALFNHRHGRPGRSSSRRSGRGNWS